MAYVDGFVIPVSPGKKEEYRRMAAEAAPMFKEFGAIEIVECFEDDIKDGKVTDFRRAVGAEPGEQIVFSWIVYPSKEVRDEANRKMMEDPRMQPSGEMPFNMQRMIFGGFEPIFQTGSSTIEAPAAAEREPA
ncbi:MAG TPA: DUF1428 domain-containing protein [Allosphingosinicella sp.]|nr:DUF1428 domain-containing protein [Allosphingosinicella sp.]